MSWKDKYTEAQVEQIKQIWADEPPKECTGNCKIVDNNCLTACVGCDWCDLGVPLT